MSVRSKLEAIVKSETEPVEFPPTHRAIGKCLEMLADELDRVEKSIGVKVGDGGKLVDEWNRKDG